jgi:hypothetical protein
LLHRKLSQLHPRTPIYRKPVFRLFNSEDSNPPFSTMVTNMATTRERDVETETETETTFHPARITPQTFQTLLDCYSTTARNVQRRKAMLKQQPKDSKKRKTSSPPLTKTNFDPAEERSIQDEVEKYLDLDRMRYETLPGTVWRREDEEGQGQGPRFTKEELVRIMEWKT